MVAVANKIIMLFFLKYSQQIARFSAVRGHIAHAVNCHIVAAGDSGRNVHFDITFTTDASLTATASAGVGNNFASAAADIAGSYLLNCAQKSFGNSYDLSGPPALASGLF